MTYVITSPCIDVQDQSCVEVCPVDCIHFEEGSDRMLYIDPDECIDCGACEPVCPVTAIFPEDDVPADEEAFKAINVDWFANKQGCAGSGRGDQAASGVTPLKPQEPVELNVCLCQAKSKCTSTTAVEMRFRETNPRLPARDGGQRKSTRTRSGTASYAEGHSHEEVDVRYVVVGA